METFGVFLAGVGGQGIILASEIISTAACLAGLDVKQSEVHGMSQRGGSVVGHVKFGTRVASPLIAEGEADVLLSFEKLEALRHINFLKPTGKVISSDLEILPATVLSGAAEYPRDIWEQIRKIIPDALLISAEELAKQAGSIKSANVVLIGALSPFLPFDEPIWIEAVKKCVPQKTIDTNLKAFELGRNKVGKR